jgi:acetyl esterase/lipase
MPREKSIMEKIQHAVIPLWPAGAPGSETWDQIEEETTMPDGLPVVRNVTHPTLTVYPAVNPNGTSVIVAPGGAWHFLAIEHEGRQVAEWLAARGITVFLLKYRLIRTGADMQKDLGDFFSSPDTRAARMGELLPLTLADAEQAVRIVRQRAGEWGINPNRVGFMGFSAGGAVAAQAALYTAPDGRPDFVAPIYAAVFDEVKAPADAPPLFLLCTDSDDMASHASMLLYDAWKAVKRPVELHIYAQGDHGFGMTTKGLPADTWIERFTDWMKGLGYS